MIDPGVIHTMDTASSRLTSTTIAALLTGSVTAIGWFVTKILDTRSQARLKRLDFRRVSIQKQIEELYGPLYSLVWQIVTIHDLKERVLDRQELSEDDRSKVSDYFIETYFMPIHGRIKTILESKLYLIDGVQMPSAFYEYLRHSLQETVQQELWKRRGIDTGFVEGIPYPEEFSRAVEDSLKKLMAEYEVSVRELQKKSRSRMEVEDIVFNS